MTRRDVVATAFAFAGPSFGAEKKQIQWPCSSGRVRIGRNRLTFNAVGGFRLTRVTAVSVSTSIFEAYWNSVTASRSAPGVNERPQSGHASRETLVSGYTRLATADMSEWRASLPIQFNGQFAERK
jgi:hypothetical protein